MTRLELLLDFKFGGFAMVTIAILTVAFVALIVIFLSIMGVKDASQYMDDSFRWGEKNEEKGL